MFLESNLEVVSLLQTTNFRSSDDFIGYMVPHHQNVQKHKNRKCPSQ